MNNTVTRKPKKTGHHHGALREALIEAGIEILQEEGVAKLTLRACASRAGVSHSAPAHHFDGIEGLLTAIASRGFSIFSNAMIKEREQSTNNPKQQLLAICNAYLRFSDNNASLYNLMFSSELLCFGDADLNSASASAYQVLADSCAPFEHGTAGSAATEIMIWSLLHGYVGISRKANLPGRQHSHPASSIRFEDILPELKLRN